MIAPKTPQKNKRQRGFLRKKPLLIGLVIVVLLAAGAVGYFYYDRNTSNSINPPNTINYDEPTDDEKKATEEFKEQQQKEAENPPAPTPTPGTKQTVEPTISYVGQYDASIEGSAFVSSVIEDGGTCTLTFKKGTSTIVKTSQGVKDARSTRCSLFMFPSSELSKGTWSATVTYDSPTSNGTSKPTTLEVK